MVIFRPHKFFVAISQSGYFSFQVPLNTFSISSDTSSSDKCILLANAESLCFHSFAHQYSIDSGTLLGRVRISPSIAARCSSLPIIFSTSSFRISRYHANVWRDALPVYQQSLAIVCAFSLSLSVTYSRQPLKEQSGGQGIHRFALG